MLAEIEALLVLQDRDRKLLDLQRDLERIPKDEQRARTRLDDDTAQVARCKEALLETEVAIKRVELDAGTRRTSITRLRQQQFETRKNEEYQALAHEIVRYSNEVDQLETRELELMEEADRHRLALAEAERALAACRLVVDDELAVLTERRRQLEERRVDLAADRAKLATAVPENLLPLYERLFKTKNGVAVVPVDAGKCGGCHMKLVPATLVRVQGGTTIVQCEDCGRILHQEL